MGSCWKPIVAALLFFATGVGVSLTWIPAMSVDEWGKAFDAPALGGAGVDASGLALEWGHLKISAKGCRAFPVQAGGQVVGMYLLGRGQFQYRSADPYEYGVMRTNLQRNGIQGPLPPGELGGGFTDALVLVYPGADRLVPDPAWTAGAAPAEAQEAFKRHLERYGNDRGTRYTHLLPQAMAEPAEKETMAVAEMTGDAQDLVWVLDPLRSDEESISVLKKSRSSLSFLKDRRYPQVLSGQPHGRKRLEGLHRRFTLTDLDVALTNPEGLSVEVAATEAFTAAVPLKTLDLVLYTSRLGTTGTMGNPSEKPYTLGEVTTAEGTALPFHHLSNDLVVELPRTLNPGERITLRFRMSGEILFRPGNDNYWELGTEPWLPLPRRLEESSFTYHATCKAAKPFLAFSNGQTMRRWEEGNLSCAEFREEKPIQLPVVLAGKYDVYSEKFNEFTVQVASYALGKKGVSQNLAKLAVSFLQFLYPIMGVYPYKELKIIEINDYGYGQSPGGILFITKEAFTPRQDLYTQVFSEGINGRIVHEIVHGWWGNQAQLGADQDQWISESVTEYVSAWALGKLKGEGEFKKALAQWESEARAVKDRGTVLLANQMSGDDGDDDRTRLLYNRGPVVLHALRCELGDDVFFTILRSFLKSFPFKTAETRHFIGLSGVVAKRDLSVWFEKYLLGTEWPSYNK